MAKVWKTLNLAPKSQGKGSKFGQGPKKPCGKHTISPLCRHRLRGIQKGSFELIFLLKTPGSKKVESFETAAVSKKKKFLN
jgi:hypothetical protein